MFQKAVKSKDIILTAEILRAFFHGDPDSDEHEAGSYFVANFMLSFFVEQKKGSK